MRPIPPPPFHSVTPYLIVKGASEAIAFYQSAFGATERFRMTLEEGGLIGHAEIQIGDAVIMLADENPQWNVHGPAKFGGSPVNLLLYVDDVDAVFARALELGAESVYEVKNQFYGDRSGCLRDPFGHSWTIATPVEEVPRDELERRWTEIQKQGKDQACDSADA